ncbi:MAG TPA: heme-binding domain-containing protein [Candidatus Methylomirabilis sp.]|nr:heme-binding domain-containing protein [Candidatus Methylomirabilis sp.]
MMRFRWKRVLLGLVVVLVVAQLIPVAKTNPPVEATRTLWAASAVPPEVSAILQRSCQDCHTNRTTWPWYSHVAPVSWVVVSDVNGARQHMNLDEWGAYDLEKKQSRLTKICEELKSGDMPDSKYTLIHRGARLTDQQRSTLCDWAEATRKALVNTITNH